MARSIIPKLGYPCLAASTDNIALVGLGSSTPADTANPTYPIHSFTLPKKSIIQEDKTTISAEFTLRPNSASPKVRALEGSRTICAMDNAETFLYIFNDKIYIENTANPALAATEPLSGWNAAGGLAPQVVFSKGLPGMFQWLGLSNNQWVQYDIDASGFSSPMPAQVPENLPTTGVKVIIREAENTFLVIYNVVGVTEGARFRLGPGATSTIVEVNTKVTAIMTYLDFATVAHVQNANGTYFLGPAPIAATASQPAMTITTVAKTNLTSSSIWLSSTRTAPSDDNGFVAPLYTYGTAAQWSSNNVLVYGGLVNGATNAWNFDLVSAQVDAGNLVDLYVPFQSNGDAGVFSKYIPPVAPVEDNKGLPLAAIIGIAVGAVALLMLAVLLFIFQRRNKKIKAHDKISLSVRDMHSKGATASTHSLIHGSDATGTPRGQTSVSTERPVENLTLRVPIVRYDGRDVARSVPNAGLGAVVLSQYRLGSTNISMLNHIMNPSKIISLHQTMIIPAALEWRHILVLDAHDSTLDIRLAQTPGRILPRQEQREIVKAIVSGLVWCHQKDVIHLSMCTGSLVLNENDEWVLWSFGGARFLNEAVGIRQGTLIGHEHGAVERNMAPELMNARRSNHLDSTLSTAAMDAWSAGCVLFEVLTGQPLFRTEEAADQAATGRFNAWKDRLAEIHDPQERRVVEGLLVLDPNYRLTLSQAEAILV
ncbi:polo-like kinase 3 [Podila epigama]|nr:polo-like kinase 3 [Podila epigama]